MKIALTGSHSVGKTVLLNKLIIPNHIKIPEIARQMIKKWQKLPHEMTAEEMFQFEMEIILEQLKQEEQAQNNFISDRCVYDMLAYSQDLPRYLELEKYVLEHAQGYDYVFYLPIEFPLQLDDIRKNDEQYRQDIDEKIRAIFKKMNIKYYTISGTVEERLKQIYDILNLK